jgi:hypothetical protein
MQHYVHVNDVESFKRRLRRTDDDTKHQGVSIAAVVFALFGTFSGHVSLGVGAAGICLIAGAVYTLRAGKSVDIRMDGEDHDAKWYESMLSGQSITLSPERAAAVYIMLGLLCFVIALSAW